MGKYCAGLGATTIIQYKCKTTTYLPVRTTITTTSLTTTTIPPCTVEQAAIECNEVLADRLKFETIWSVQEKIHWCKSVTEYVRCAGKHISNCSIIDVRDDVEQLSNFIEYIIKQANLHCQGEEKQQQKKNPSLSNMFSLFVSLGGFYGCEQTMATDVRCRQSPRKFYSGEAFDSAPSFSMLNGFLLIFSLIFVSLTNFSIE